ALGTVGEVLVVGGHRLEVIALALGFRAHLPSLVDRGLRPRRVLGRGADSLQRVRHQDRGESPGRDGAGIVLRGDLPEGPFRRGIVERVQHRHAAQELLLHRRAARVRKLDLAELIGLLAGRLAEGAARRGERNGDQRRDADTRFHLVTLPIQNYPTPAWYSA